MTWHVVVLAGPNDTFSPDVASGDQVVLVPFEVPGHADSVRTTLPDLFAEHVITPSTNARDLLRAAIAAYTGDIRVPRSSAYDGWTRDMALHLPVEDMGMWRTVAGTFEQMLAFLTGDHWVVNIRSIPHDQRLASASTRPHQPVRADVVSLFSGGLDSFIGALDLLAENDTVALVGHHSLGGGPTSASQTGVAATLRVRYSEERAPVLRAWVSPPKGVARASETTTRGRSLLFLALGVTVASGLDAQRLVVPENGVISLNVPLTASRVGSFSTRTTHPYLLARFGDLLAGIGIEISIETPYRFLTKGEMIRQCADAATLSAGLAATMSCSHPGVGRFERHGSANRHCGYCVPCLIRRAAITASMTDPTTYHVANLSLPLSVTRGSDRRAVRLALDRFRRHPPRLADVLIPGPLPGTDSELEGYLDVFRRGLTELGSFMDMYP